MAYKQTPGRGNSPKTGNGIPTPFKQIGDDTDDTLPIGNKKGYNPSASPIPNTENKGGYEKTLDRTSTDVYLRNGENKIIGSARIGSKAGDEIERVYKNVKNDTESRRTNNKDWLESRQKTGSIVK